MSNVTLLDQLKNERAQAGALLNQWANAKDELTLDINRIADRAAREYLREGLAPESGDIYRFSSLVYPTPAIAEVEFEKHNPHVYGRNGGPVLSQYAEIIKLFDPGAAEARVTTWGMGAVAAALYPLKTGDHVVASELLFGGCYVALADLRQQRGVEVTFIDGTNPQEWEKAVRPATKMFWFETPSNPTGKIIDIRAVSNIAHSAPNDILVVADNSLGFSAHAPLRDGADIVAASLTKTFGLGTSGSGALIFSADGIRRHQRHMGDTTGEANACFDAFAKIGATPPNGAAVLPLIEMARSLPGRVQRQTETATLLARELRDNHKNVILHHPALDNPHPQMKGISVFSIDLRSKERAFALIEELGRHGIEQINNFGGLKTAITHPASTTHKSLTPELQAQQGITPGLLRVTVGIENPELVLKIFDTALRTLPPLPAARIIRAAPGQLAA